MNEENEFPTVHCPFCGYRTCYVHNLQSHFKDYHNCTKEWVDVHVTQRFWKAKQVGIPNFTVVTGG